MLSLVIPTYNESANIAEAIGRVRQVLNGRDYEIIVADDDSPDRTWAIAEQLGDPQVRVLRRTGDRGLAPAVMHAFATARGDVLGVMDADLQHDERILPHLIEAVKDHELAVGSRAVIAGGYGDWTLPRQLLSRFGSALVRLTFRIPIRDPMSGFFLLRRELYERVRRRVAASGFKLLLEIYAAGRPRRVAEIGYRFRTRRAGDSKLSLRVAWRDLATFRRLLELAAGGPGAAKGD